MDWQVILILLAILGEILIVATAWWVADLKGRSPLLWALLAVFSPSSRCYPVHPPATHRAGALALTQALAESGD